MNTIIIGKEILERYFEENSFEENDVHSLNQLETSEDENIELDLEKISKNLLEYILTNDTQINLQTKAEITLNYLKNDVVQNSNTESNIWDKKIKSLSDIMEVYETLKKIKYNVDCLIFRRKNPAKLVAELLNATRHSPKRILFRLDFKIYKDTHSLNYELNNDNIISLRKEMSTLSFRDLMKIFNVFEQQENLSKYENRIVETKKTQKQDSKQILCKGLGLSSHFELTNMGSFNKQSSCIVESELEIQVNNRYTNDSFKSHIELPYVRVFSLLYKEYVYVHIDDISDYEYDEQAFQKLFLPKNLKNILEKVFSYSVENLTTDIINNKHGGLIIMAEGNSGTGKTSTAEVYSELNKKPLYIVQVDEIGISPDKIEQNLNHIFRRVEKWNAIILFDEVDVFLSKRGDNIEKSAIVGIFLRLMDYFRGMMFFTTNRSEVIDDAVLSRITLNIKYPDLTDDVRKLIWKSKLESAGLYIDSMDELIKINLNGRQIRNMVRLGKIIFDDKINEQKFIDLIHNSVPKSEK
ncbi:MAG TPA: AAA family ATPase [Chitinophagales bacterium]|nr:AAA family ATPase [Chitinophagales bacterium]MCB0512045.1 AAA family ATPase [Bacteroidota bacterium]HMU99023.1 AAA family ATPase [Chitinophagales bacterium]HMV03165.1 AAA family ATPase [Chitinophagales bacterium]HMW95339.1 AAA family ATPase [Chitinophagales bacterium]